MNSERRSRLFRDAQQWALVVLLVLVVVVGYYVSNLNGSVDQIDDTVGRIEQSSNRTEASAAELVKFVHEVQAQQPCPTTTTSGETTSTTVACQPSSSSQTNQAVQLLIGVLCASSDPVRIKACADLTNHGG